MPESNTDISVLRLAIDEIDAKILNLINQRLLLAQQIGAAKKQGGIQVIDHRREKDIMDRLRRKNKGPLDGDGLQGIFRAIIAAGRSAQTTDGGPQ
ncbi:MAG: chorismate mutase [Desulfobacterales bacterium]|jgi:chorismate mutase/prephenate dehydratase